MNGLSALISKTAEQLSGVSADNVTDFDKAFVNNTLFQHFVNLTTAMQKDRINGFDYGVTADGTTDDTTALTNALAAVASQNAGVLILPPGIIKITSKITVSTFGVKIIGSGYSSDAAVPATLPGRTKILKTGNFDAFQITGDSVSIENLDVEGASGNGGDGISIEGSRCVLRDVSCRGHAGVGIRIGKNSNNNNLWRLFNVLCLNNTSHGIYIHDDGGGAPDANAGCAFGLDLRSNGGDGLLLGNCLDNQFYGLHAASNTGFGINTVSGSNGHFFAMPYLESNVAGQGQLISGARDNLVWGVRQNVDDGWTIATDADDNVVLGRNNSLDDMFSVIGNLAFSKLHIGDHPFVNSGQWQLVKNPTTRNLEISKTGTSANAHVVIGNVSGGSGTVDLYIVDGGLRVGGVSNAIINQIISGTATWNPADLADEADESVTVTVTGAAVGDPCLVGLTTLTTDDFLITANVTAANTCQVVIKNVSGGNVNLASGTVRVVVFKF